MFIVRQDNAEREFATGASREAISRTLIKSRWIVRAGFTMALDFPSTIEIHHHAEENIAIWRSDKAIAIRPEGDEKRTCTLLQVPGWGCDTALERKNLLGMQCGECVIRNDELRRAYSDFLRGGAAWPKDRNPRSVSGERPRGAVLALRRLPAGDL
jgi:hypothetical protein